MSCLYARPLVVSKEVFCCLQGSSPIGAALFTPLCWSASHWWARGPVGVASGPHMSSPIVPHRSSHNAHSVCTQCVHNCVTLCTHWCVTMCTHLFMSVSTMWHRFVCHQMEMLDCNICRQKYNDHMVVKLPQGMCYGHKSHWCKFLCTCNNLMYMWHWRGN